MSRQKKMLRKAIPIDCLRENTQEGCLTGVFLEDYEGLRNSLRDAADLKFRIIHTAGNRKAAIFYYANLTDGGVVSQSLIKPLQEYQYALDPDYIAQNVINISEFKKEKEHQLIGNCLADGSVAVLLEGVPEAVIFNVLRIEHRSIERAQTEDVLIGPHESFSENLGDNLALLRRRLATPQLKIKEISLGTVSRTKVAIIYLEGIVQQKLVDEVEERLRRIDIDYVLGATMLSSFLEDEPLSLFPILRVTERPVRVVPVLAEGRVVIMADGDPGVLIAPSFAPEYIQSTEDYFERPIVATFLRFIRLIGLVISVFFPGVWIALVIFHHGILPHPLFTSIVAGREGVPLPTVLEMFILLFVFDIIIEASSRMPSRVGQALGIVGGLLLGQSAVQAGLVSTTLVIVVALTGVAIFTQPVPTFVNPIRLLKYPVVLAASLLGLFGLVWILIYIILQVSALRSFGYPYMYPMAPFYPKAEMDIFARLPLFWLQKRPKFLSPKNVKRMNVTAPRSGKGE
ncbi:MAG: spore germination protein [Bacillota bacterium]|nr:spore germination protein [Bacillota bacterium]